MKTFIVKVFLVSVWACSTAFASDSNLDNWMGFWTGSCQISPPYNGTKNFDASLKVSLTQSNHIQWQLIYEASGNLPRQVRDYEMVTIDAAKKHYAIDEHNGLLLDSFVDEKIIYSPFTINGKLITATYIMLNANEMLIDMPSFTAAPIRKTCLTGNANLCAETFGLRMVQRCQLKRTEL